MLLLFFALSALTLLIGVFFCIRKKSDRQQALSPYQWLVVFLFVASLLFFIPYYLAFFQYDPLGEKLISTVFLSAHHAICLFVVGADYSEVYSYAISNGALGVAYSLYGAVLYLASPLMTFGFILSFFQNLTMRMRIGFGKKSIYLFSQLNEPSIHLAKDIHKLFPKALILFSDVQDRDSDLPASLERSAKALGAILFHRDIVSVVNSLPRHIQEVSCMVLGESDEKNVQHTSLLLQTEHTYPLHIYVHSHQENYLFEDLPLPHNTLLTPVKHVRHSVLQTLRKSGELLFQNATPDENGEKIIGVVVLGMGAYGSEMTKALSWFTQAEGYCTQLHCFDCDPLAIEHFAHTCPGYFYGDSNKNHCNIQLYSDFTYGTIAFDNMIAKLKNISYVYIALGDDDLNIRTAYELRMLFSRGGSHPVIHALVHNSDKAQLLKDRKTYRGKDYDLSFVGSLKEFYTFESILSLKRKEQLLEQFSKWAPPGWAEKALSQSTVYEETESLVMHRLVTEHLHMDSQKRTRSEHRRWVNMKYSEGYLPRPLHEKMDDLTKLHPYLRDYEFLPDHVQNYLLNN